ncbi:hypothetical protein JYT21_00195 [bacterium AH-315-B15]|nr:hypothetical protein [bacterium AH-315-B15]
MKDERGTTLKVLCVLSWVWIGLLILITAKNLISGPPTQEFIDNTKAQTIQDQPEEQIESMRWLYDEIFYIIDESAVRHYQIEGTYMSIYLLGLMATILMWKLRRSGFYMYLVYTVAVIGGAAYFYQGLTGLYMYFFGLMALIFGGLFCILYGVQLSRMK